MEDAVLRRILGKDPGPLSQVDATCEAAAATHRARGVLFVVWGPAAPPELWPSLDVDVVYRLDADVVALAEPCVAAFCGHLPALPGMVLGGIRRAGSTLFWKCPTLASDKTRFVVAFETVPGKWAKYKGSAAVVVDALRHLVVAKGQNPWARVAIDASSGDRRVHFCTEHLVHDRGAWYLQNHASSMLASLDEWFRTHARRWVRDELRRLGAASVPANVVDEVFRHVVEAVPQISAYFSCQVPELAAGSQEQLSSQQDASLLLVDMDLFVWDDVERAKAVGLALRSCFEEADRGN